MIKDDMIKDDMIKDDMIEDHMVNRNINLTERLKKVLWKKLSSSFYKNIKRHLRRNIDIAKTMKSLDQIEQKVKDLRLESLVLEINELKCNMLQYQQQMRDVATNNINTLNVMDVLLKKQEYDDEEMLKRFIEL